MKIFIYLLVTIAATVNAGLINGGGLLPGSGFLPGSSLLPGSGFLPGSLNAPGSLYTSPAGPYNLYGSYGSGRHLIAGTPEYLLPQPAATAALLPHAAPAPIPHYPHAIPEFKSFQLVQPLPVPPPLAEVKTVHLVKQHPPPPSLVKTLKLVKQAPPPAPEVKHIKIVHQAPPPPPEIKYVQIVHDFPPPPPEVKTLQVIKHLAPLPAPELKTVQLLHHHHQPEFKAFELVPEPIAAVPEVNAVNFVPELPGHTPGFVEGGEHFQVLK